MVDAAGMTDKNRHAPIWKFHRPSFLQQHATKDDPTGALWGMEEGKRTFDTSVDLMKVLQKKIAASAALYGRKARADKLKLQRDLMKARDHHDAFVAEYEKKQEDLRRQLPQDYAAAIDPSSLLETGPEKESSDSDDDFMAQETHL